ncbi:hypothetical protein NA57DRAFT_44645 [Rhizodiscina lignyota]|uniref:WD40 repeat-like protein n=1 Tax=Rhizodiscina lignyota TaxID=1504668 RepID=A0A9P4M3H9_9PEZI|nr:hypothetical protein NA57DRAFT_44645 [Rhizodiscina lignyota]
MAADGARRASNPPLSLSAQAQAQAQAHAHPAPPPPPPPLPPPRNVTARNAFARFVTQSLSTYGAARPQTASTSRSDGGRPRAAPFLPVIQGVNALSSQDATHRTGLEISAFDINQERTHAVLAGREILKTVHVNGTRCSEEANLRTAIINYASHNTKGSGRHRETLDIHDVKWSHGAYSTHIATAATNGKVVLYDLGRAGIELARLHEHYRQVHKLAFNPHQGYLLLSGSQDASVRLWDLRRMSKDKDVFSCRSQQTYHGQSEGIRDLRWSPTDGFEFAFGTDNGVIQRWDTRYAKGPKLKISAHDKTCHAIDWHPDGKHLLSASSDKTVKVWDFSSEQRRQKPAWVLRTPYPVSNVRWRPPCFASSKQDQGAWHSTQFATTFEKHSPVMIWDFRRPYVPFREIVKWSTPPTDMLWHSQHLLWTVGREGIFAQSDIHFAPKVLDRRNMQAFALSPIGDICAFSQKRSKRRDSGLEYMSDYSTSLESRDRRSATENSSAVNLSRSSADDSIDDSFLSSSFRRHHGRTSSNRSAKSISSTPPSSDEFPMKSLEDSLKNQNEHYRPNQASFRGNIGGAIELAHFAFLAQKYKSAPLRQPLSIESFQDVGKIFEQNADYAQRTAAYRIAQSFRITGSAVSYMLNQRAEAMRRKRLGLASTKEAGKIVRQSSLVKIKKPEDRRLLTPAIKATQGPESALKTVWESTSNVPTPLARPQNTTAISHTTVPSLSELDREDPVALPPPIAGPPPISPTLHRAPTEPHRSHMHRPEFHSPQWFSSTGDLSERRAMLSQYRQPPKAPLNLEPPSMSSPQVGPINIPPSLGRHNSDESFAMFSTSSDSRNLSVPGSLASARSVPRQMDAVPEAWEGMGSAESSGKPQTSLLSPKAAIQPESSVMSPKLASQPLPFNRIADVAPSSSGSGPSHGTHGTWSTSNTSASRVENLEASGTIVPEEGPSQITSPQGAYTPKLPHETRSVPAALQSGLVSDLTSQALIVADFASPDGTDTESSLPFSIVELLQSLLEYHTSTLSDAQTASHLLLLLTPLLPPTHASPNNGDSRMLAAYTDHLTSLGLPPDTVERTLSTSLTGFLQNGLHPLQAETILSTYHAQLLSLQLYNSAAQLRRLCYPAFPAVYEQSIKDTSVGMLCLACGSPINNPRGKMRCETCSRRQAPCPVCWCERTQIEISAPNSSKKGKRKKSKSRASSFSASAMAISTSLGVEKADAIGGGVGVGPERSNAAPQAPLPTLWLTCPLCNHGGHLACLSSWFSSPSDDAPESEGACASPGCTCDCAPGALREERVLQMEQRVAKSERERGREGRVRGDEWMATESRAVSQVRGMVDPVGAGAPVGGNASGIVTASGKDREREGRRVRLVEPDGGGGLKRNWVMGN